MSLDCAIEALGGELAYVAMDQPYQFVAHDATGACRLSPQQLAANINDTRNMVRNYFPNVKFGDVEPFVHFEDESEHRGELRGVPRRLREHHRRPDEFVHDEGDVQLWAWQDTDAEIRPVLDARGIKYGIIWHGMNVARTTTTTGCKPRCGASTTTVGWAGRCRITTSSRAGTATRRRPCPTATGYVLLAAQQRHERRIERRYADRLWAEQLCVLLAGWLGRRMVARISRPTVTQASTRSTCGTSRRGRSSARRHSAPGRTSRPTSAASHQNSGWMVWFRSSRTGPTQCASIRIAPSAARLSGTA